VAYLNSLYQCPSLRHSQGIQRLMSGFGVLAKFQLLNMRDYKVQVRAYKERHGAHTDAPGPIVPGPSNSGSCSTPIVSMSRNDTVAAPLLEELQEDVTNNLGYYRSDSPRYEHHIPPTFVCLPDANPSRGD
jgi:hypothetical protein